MATPALYFLNPPHAHPPHTQGRKMIETKRVTGTAFPMDILYRRKHMRFRYLSHMRKSQMCHPALQVVEGLTWGVTYIQTLCMRVAKVLARLRRLAWTLAARQCLLPKSCSGL